MLYSHKIVQILKNKFIRVTMLILLIPLGLFLWPFTLGGILIWFIYKKLKVKWLKYSAITIILISTILVGYAWVYAFSQVFGWPPSLKPNINYPKLFQEKPGDSSLNTLSTRLATMPNALDFKTNNRAIFSSNGRKVFYDYYKQSEDNAISGNGLVDGDSLYIGINTNVMGPFIKLPGVDYLVSPDESYVVITAYKKVEGKLLPYLIINGQEQKPYYKFPPVLRFSPDSKHIAYLVDDGIKQFIVLDGKEGKAYDSIGVVGEYAGVAKGKNEKEQFALLPYHTGEGLEFSPDGKKIAYVAKRNGKSIIVEKAEGEEEKESPDWESASVPEYSKEGKLLYIGVNDKKEHVVVDGQDLGIYDTTNTYFDGNDLVNLASRGGKTFTVLNGVEGKRYDDIQFLDNAPFYNSSTKKFTYKAKVGDKWRVVFNNEEWKLYDSISKCTISPDSQRLACVINYDKDPVIGFGFSFVSVDNHEQSKNYYRRIDAPVFSLDSKKVAHIVPEEVFFTRGEGSVKKYFVVVDGQKGKGYGSIDSLSFNSAGEPVYIASDFIDENMQSAGEGDRRYYLVGGNKEGKRYNALYVPIDNDHDSYLHLRFNKDHSHLAYIADTDAEHIVMLDDKKLTSFPLKKDKDGRADNVPITNMDFFPNGKDVVMLKSMDDVKKLSIIVNSHEGTAYNDIWWPVKVSPDNKTVLYGARDGKYLWWVADPID